MTINKDVWKEIFLPESIVGGPYCMPTADHNTYYSYVCLNCQQLWKYGRVCSELSFRRQYGPNVAILPQRNEWYCVEEILGSYQHYEPVQCTWTKSLYIHLPITLPLSATCEAFQNKFSDFVNYTIKKFLIMIFSYEKYREQRLLISAVLKLSHSFVHNWLWQDE